MAPKTSWVIWVLTAAICLLIGPSHALTIPQSSSKSIGTQSLQKRQLPLPKKVYRGSPMSPEQVRALGGFIPRGVGEATSNDTFSLRNHHRGNNPTAYTSTSRSFGVGLGYSVKHGDGWVYKIHATPNMIDMDGSNFRLDHAHEEEFSALGGVLFNQIQAWMFIPSTITAGGVTVEDVVKYHDFETFAGQYPNYTWTENIGYNHRYDFLHASHGQPQLAGDKYNKFLHKSKTLEEYAAEFMNKNGCPVGWDGKFPLSFAANAIGSLSVRTTGEMKLTSRYIRPLQH
ncbi:hypothetical protein QQS21_003154 [Conoideocrella luteorostrata]|uniref:Uncharacterized protein n=1 Tax=Conoideocrella luteorostrata TaxID=1105319 RepID=A0AAJ0CTU7_9HYPO|nr:hypothetical protein QQS21_003154 [Conoideocrella luteorostrata]